MGIPLARGVSGLQGTGGVVGLLLATRTGLLPTCPLATEPLAIGVMSVERQSYNYILHPHLLKTDMGNTAPGVGSFD